MVSIVLDASALLRLLLKQAGADRVLQLLQTARQPGARVLISSINWGEVVGRIDAVHGRFAAQTLMGTLVTYGLEIIPASAERAERAALLKRDWKMGYADAFCVELASSMSGSTLVSADFDFLAAEHFVNIEMLPGNFTSPAESPLQ